MPYRINPFTGDLDLVLGPGEGTGATDFATDSGSAAPSGAGVITVSGGTGVNTSGAGSTVTVNIDSPVTVANGGTGVSSLTANSIITSGATSTDDLVALGPLTNGQLVIGSTGVAPVAAALTSSGATVTITNGAGTINLEAAASVPTSFTTDSGSAVPALGVLTVSGGTGISTSGAGSTVTVTLDTPVTVANGGTGNTAFTAGSVVFSNGTILTQDNSNLFWDDTNNRLGIGTTTPLDSLHIVDGMDLEHTSAEADDHAFEIHCNAAGFGDVKALSIDYITGALAAGDDEEVILVNIDESLSTGGEIAGYQILATAEGLATIHGYTTGININPILHNTGTFGDIDNILNKAVDVTAALASGGAGSISAFVADNDTMTFGDAAEWNEMEFILGTGASGAGIGPTFEFSTGGAGFTAFSPSDGTNGMRNTGAMLWIADDLTGWATNASGLFEIRITRTRNSLSTTPILDEVQLSSATEFFWDKAGDVSINSLTLVTDLSVANGGTGASTLTGVLTGNGTSAVTANAVTEHGVLVGGASNAVASTAVGTSGDVLTSNGAGVAPTYQTPTVGTVTSVSGTANRISSTGGATPIINIDTAYVGQATITTLGTVTTGTWTATDIAAADGGTGRSSHTAYAVLCGGTTTTAAQQSIASVGTAAQVLTSNGAGALPTFQAAGGGGDVTAGANLTDNAVVRGDGGAKGVQTSTMLISDAGEMTNPSQPAFYAYLTPDDANVTGNNTAYILGQGNALTEIFDQGTDFDVGGSGGSAQATFTAPVTGRYFLTAAIVIENGTGGTFENFWIRTSNGNFRKITLPNITTSGITRNSRSITAFCDMDATDTAYVEYLMNGIGADTADVSGSSTRFTYFQGFLVC